MKGTVLFWISILFLVPNRIYGQDHLYINRTLQDFAAKMEFSGSGIINQRPEVIQNKIAGSVYLNDEFEEGDIYTTGNVRFTGIPMRFNAFQSEIEVLMPDNKIYVLSMSDKIIKVSLDSSDLVYTRFYSPEGEKSGYLSLIYSAMSALYRRDYKVFKEGTPSNGIINEYLPDLQTGQKSIISELGQGCLPVSGKPVNCMKYLVLTPLMLNYLLRKKR